MWLLYMGHFISNHAFGVCNLYWFKLACSASETWNLGIDNYEHLIYYLDNENKSWPDRTGYYSGKWKPWHIYGTVLMHQRLSPGTWAPLCPPGGGGGYSNLFCICRLGPSIYRSPQKNIRNLKHPKKIFEIFATPKNIPILYIYLKKRPRNT